MGRCGDIDSRVLEATGPDPPHPGRVERSRAADRVDVVGLCGEPQREADPDHIFIDVCGTHNLHIGLWAPRRTPSRVVGEVEQRNTIALPRLVGREIERDFTATGRDQVDIVTVQPDVERFDCRIRNSDSVVAPAAAERVSVRPHVERDAELGFGVESRAIELSWPPDIKPARHSVRPTVLATRLPRDGAPRDQTPQAQRPDLDRRRDSLDLSSKPSARRIGMGSVVPEDPKPSPR